MFTSNDFYNAFIQLMHRAGRGENVGSEVDEVIAQLEQTKTTHSVSEWQQNVANLRGSLMTHFGSAPARRDVVIPVTDHAEIRKIYFMEAVIARLRRLMAQPL